MSEEHWWIKIVGYFDGKWLIEDLRNRQVYTAGDKFKMYELVSALIETHLLTGTSERTATSSPSSTQSPEKKDV